MTMDAQIVDVIEMKGLDKYIADTEKILDCRDEIMMFVRYENGCEDMIYVWK